jgi:hypothetical protein
MFKTRSHVDMFRQKKIAVPVARLILASTTYHCIVVENILHVLDITMIGIVRMRTLKCVQQLRDGII